MKIKLGNIAYAVVQMVGNKSNADGVSFSSEKIEMGETTDFLLDLLDKSLKYDEMKHLDFIGGVQLNPVYNFVSSIFDDEASFIKQANNLATYLYQQSLHPSIRNGEFYVMKIDNCSIDEELVEAIGLFKSELHDVVLKAVNGANGIQIIPEKGMSLKKLDKGCVIFNKNRADGYVVSVLDINSHDANYWTDAFLHAVPCKDNYHNTMNYINFCKELVASDVMAHECKAEKAIMLNKAMDVLQVSDDLDFESFVGKSFGNELKEQVALFRNNYEEEHHVRLENSVSASSEALKKKALSKFTTIKLDANFDIKIKGNSNLLEHGYDETRGMNYYKLFYEKEK